MVAGSAEGGRERLGARRKPQENFQETKWVLIRFLKKRNSLCGTRKFCFAKQNCFYSGRSRPPPKPPAVLIGSGGFAPRTPFDHRAPKRLGVYSAKQQFTAILPLGCCTLVLARVTRALASATIYKLLKISISGLAVRIPSSMLGFQAHSRLMRSTWGQFFRASTHPARMASSPGWG